MPYTPRKAYVVGVGMTKFDKPRGERDYPELGLEASVKVSGAAKFADVPRAHPGQ